MRLPRTPYAPVLRVATVRRLLPGLVVSSLGDGMSVVAVAWLALQLAPPGQRGTWVAICSAAAVLPGVAVALLAGGPLGTLSPLTLGVRDAQVRTVALGAVPLAHVAGVLDVRLFAVLLGVSSLLRPWGSASRYTLLAQVVPEQHRFAGNALLSTVFELGTLLGPPFAALVIALAGPVAAIGVDAATCVALVLAYRAAGRTLPAARASGTDRPHAPIEGTSEPSIVGPNQPEVPLVDPNRDGGLGARDVLRRPAVAGLLALTFAFFALYGPVDVALPVHVAIELGAPATLLATYVSVFSAGALLGGLTAGWLERLPLWPLTTGIVVTWGCCLLPLGLGAPQPVALVAFGLGAFAYAPYMAATTSLVQRVTPVPLLPRVLALRSAILNVAVPLGAVAAGPLVVAVGARRTILVSAVATIALGVTTALAARLGKNGRQGSAGSSPPPDDARGLDVGPDVATRSER